MCNASISTCCLNLMNLFKNIIMVQSCMLFADLANSFPLHECADSQLFLEFVGANVLTNTYVQWLS